VASEVLVGIDSELKADSAVNLHHVVTIPKTGLQRFVGTVPAEILARVRTALLFAFGFE
jgi:mRNA-degrading endonuclease toxin of MazEF toxin-antitoxin module